MAIAEFSTVGLPYDPIIKTILHDLNTDKAFKQSVQGMSRLIVPYQSTMHPSDQLLEAWYRFKKNGPCPQ